jgi:hypothetical protein
MLLALLLAQAVIMSDNPPPAGERCDGSRMALLTNVGNGGLATAIVQIDKVRQPHRWPPNLGYVYILHDGNRRFEPTAPSSLSVADRHVQYEFMREAVPKSKADSALQEALARSPAVVIDVHSLSSAAMHALGVVEEPCVDWPKGKPIITRETKP